MAAKKKNQPITLDDARRVLEVVDAGLVNGMGIAQPGQMCVEAAVCYAFGEPHSDRPRCVAPAVRDYKISLNDDFCWTSDKARTAGLRRVAVAQLGSRGTVTGARFGRAIFAEVTQGVIPRTLSRYTVLGRLAGVIQSESITMKHAGGARRGAYLAYEMVRRLARDLHDAGKPKDAEQVLRDAAEAAVTALARLGCPGVKLMRQLNVGSPNF